MDETDNCHVEPFAKQSTKEDVDHQSGIALVRFNPTMLSPSQMLGAIEAAGGDGRHEYSGWLVALP
jgi:hypothetical protein